MTFDDAVEDVRAMLKTNRNGAFALAVRLTAGTGVSADKVMQAALNQEANTKLAAVGDTAALEFALVDVVFPDANAMAKQMLETAEAMGGLSPDSLILVQLFIGTIVEERNRFLKTLGVNHE